MERTAVLSPCGRYRYSLSRDWSEDESLGRVLWVMLNPSTADAEANDPTTDRCAAFSRAWGCGGMTIVNLFALRSPAPKALLPATDRIGPHNDAHIARAIEAHGRRQDLLVAAWGHWGGHPLLRGRRREVLRVLPVAETMCLRHTASGDPAHPLYVPGAAVPGSYDFPAGAWSEDAKSRSDDK